VTLLTPQTSASCDACETTVVELNAQIGTWAAASSTADSPVTAIDLYTGFVSATDLSDDVHLNEAGSQKVSDRSFAVLEPLFKP
jgi:acyl-CoA thioesterase I